MREEAAGLPRFLGLFGAGATARLVGDWVDDALKRARRR